MLDFDLAEIYETETKYLKRAVKNNFKRFPSDFMFTLTKTEWETLRCSFSASNKRGGTGVNLSDPDTIRTCDPQLRRLLLYPLSYGAN